MIVLDTCLIYANYDEDDPNHKLSRSIFKRIFKGEYAQPVILDFVYDELLTLTYMRTKNFELCIQISNLLQDFIENKIITFMHTPSEIFWKANQIFLDQDLKNQSRFLSFTDAVIGTMSEWLNASYIGTFDTQFHRFDPPLISK